MTNPFRDSANPQFEQLINGLENGEAITAGAIGTTQLATSAVTGEKIAANVVSPAKVSRAQAPVASGTESLTAEVGGTTVTTQVIAVYNAKAEASAKVKIKHGLKNEYVSVTAYEATSKKAVKKIMDNVAASTGGIVELKVISNEEIELILGTGVPAGKAEFFYVVQG